MSNTSQGVINPIILEITYNGTGRKVKGDGVFPNNILNVLAVYFSKAAPEDGVSDMVKQLNLVRPGLFSLEDNGAYKTYTIKAKDIIYDTQFFDQLRSYNTNGKGNFSEYFVRYKENVAYNYIGTIEVTVRFKEEVDPRTFTIVYNFLNRLNKTSYFSHNLESFKKRVLTSIDKYEEQFVYTIEHISPETLDLFEEYNKSDSSDFELFAASRVIANAATSIANKCTEATDKFFNKKEDKLKNIRIQTDIKPNWKYEEKPVTKQIYNTSDDIKKHDVLSGYDIVTQGFNEYTISKARSGFVAQVVLKCDELSHFVNEDEAVSIAGAVETFDRVIQNILTITKVKYEYVGNVLTIYKGDKAVVTIKCSIAYNGNKKAYRIKVNDTWVVDALHNLNDNELMRDILTICFRSFMNAEEK